MKTEPRLEPEVRRLILRAKDLLHKRALEMWGELGLYPGQPFVLRALWDQDGLTQSELTAQLNRSPSTITKKVQRMERAGFVIRRSDDSDERISRVFLTDAGRDVRPAVEKVWQKLSQEDFSWFTVQELTLFHEFLLRVCQYLENKAESGGEVVQ